MNEFVFPFFNVKDDSDLQALIWNEPSNLLNTLKTDKLQINDLLDENEFSTPINWNPDACKYITIDEVDSISKDKNSLTIVQINARSLKKNFEAIKTFISNFNTPPDVIAIAETWLKDHEDKFYQISGYYFVSVPRKGKLGGGVGIYLSNFISMTIRNDLMALLGNCCESAAIEISLTNKKSFIVLSIYRPPNNDVHQFNVLFNTVLQNITSNSNRNIIIAGDTNIDLIKYKNHAHTEEFINNLLSSGFLPTINRPTRISEYTSTLIDNIFVNCFELVKHSAIIHDDFSDHMPTLTTISTTRRPGVDEEEAGQTRSYNKTNFDNFHTLLTQTNWSTFSTVDINTTDPNILYNNFICSFQGIFNEAFPFTLQKSKAASSKISQPWMTQSLKRSCRKKSRLQKKYKKYPNIVNKIKYKNYRKTLRICILNAEKEYHHSKLINAASDMRKTWNTLNTIINKSVNSSNTITLNINNTLIHDPKTIVNKFNDFFVHIGSTLASQIPASNKSINDFLPSSNQNSILLHETDKTEVSQIIKKLQNKYSAGLDGIPINIIKFASNFVSEPLSKIINCSLINGIFPQNLKEAKVIPIFKSGDSTALNNYRPISMLNSFSKVFEKVIFLRLTDFLNKHDFFYHKQFGFRQDYSTSSAIIKFHEFITDSIEKNEIPVSIMIDFSKAFDTVDHQVLIKKLYRIGIRGIALSLISNYLTNRIQKVFYKDILSSPLEVTCGVPQGSILGPLLFLIYINDIFRSSSILKFILYADDTTILFSTKSLNNINTILNAELDKVAEWLKANKLSINVAKTNVIIFNKCQTQSNTLQIFINNLLVNQVNSIKFLGVEINSDLNWKDHIKTITSKIARSLGIIGRIRHKLTSKAAMLLYDTLILSHITYCSIIWGSTYKTSLAKMYNIQKKALKLCYEPKTFFNNKRKCTPHNHANAAKSSSIFKTCNKLSIYSIIKCQTAIFVYKTLNKLSPPCFHSLFKSVPFVHSHSTRFHENNNLFITQARSNYKKFAISVRGPLLWNSLPPEIKNSDSLSIFKTKIKLHFFTEPL